MVHIYSYYSREIQLYFVYALCWSSESCRPVDLIRNECSMRQDGEHDGRVALALNNLSSVEIEELSASTKLWDM